MTVNQIYTRLLLLGALFAPLLWFVLSDDGQRVSDIFLLKLGGAPEVLLDYNKLDSGIDETAFRKQLNDVEFKCGDQASQFGTQLCFAPVAAFNGTPSQYLSVFFDDNRLSAIKLSYQRAYHDYLYFSVVQQLGEPLDGTDTDIPEAERIQQWRTGHGVVLMPGETLAQGEEPVLLWLAQ